MGKIYFDNISNFRKNWLQKSAFLTGISCIVFGLVYNMMYDNEPLWVERVTTIGFILFAFYFVSKVIRKNYVQWNKVGMTIRINNYFQEKKITFNEVSSYDLVNDKLIIHTSNKTIEIDLKNTLESDKKRLLQIIADNTKTSNG